jgi:Icc protein
MPDRIAFLHLSDLHLAPPGRLVAGFDPVQTLTRVLAAIDRLPMPPAFCVVSGDLADDGAEESYRLARTLLSPLAARGIPVLSALGNHDNRMAFRRGFLGLDAASDNSPYIHAQAVDGIGVVVLDSAAAGTLADELGERQLAWLEERLREPAPLGHVVVLHHCLRLATYTYPLETLGLRDSAALEALVARHRVLGVLAGHAHQALVASFGGTLYTTAPGVLCQFDFFSGDSIAPVAGTGFNLCTVRDGELMVHPVLLPAETPVRTDVGSPER